MTFQPLGLADGSSTETSGNFRVDFDNSQSASTNTACGSTSAPYANLPAATRNLLQSGSAAPSTLTLTMSGLTVGQAYTFEWWTNNSRTNFLGEDGELVTATAGSNSVTLKDNTSVLGNNPGNNQGGVGQFDIGTFTADAATEVVTYTSPNYAPVLNAFELRTVPEPSTWALLGVGAGLLGFVTLRRQRRA